MTLAVVAFAYHVASRLAYVGYVGRALTLEQRAGRFTRRYGAALGFRRFRRAASVLMGNDAVSFVGLCLVSRNTLVISLPSGWRLAAGGLLVLFGLATKLWAAATLGVDGYYWRNFFPSGEVAATTAGPYRFLKNPMYTVGYLQAYGLALVTRSGLGLLAALFDQVAILAFHQRVEKPHFDRLTRPGTSSRPGVRDGTLSRGSTRGSPIQDRGGDS